MTDAWSLYGRRVRWPVGVCDTCGHVQLAQLFTPQEHMDLNNETFQHQYNAATEDQRASTRDRKRQNALERLAPVVQGGGGRLLDVGAGEGWGHDVARQLGLDYHFVEAQPDLVARLEGAGAIFAAGTIQDLPSRWSGQFRVIMLRHLLEHLLDPIGDLEVLAKCLASNGMLYVVVPNFSRANPRGRLVTDFLRPRHISFFTPQKLEWCLRSAGLEPDAIHPEGEIWAVARPDKTQPMMEDEREVNRERFVSLMRADRPREVLNIVKLLGRRWMPELPSPVRWLVKRAWRTLRVS